MTHDGLATLVVLHWGQACTASPRGPLQCPEMFLVVTLGGKCYRNLAPEARVYNAEGPPPTKNYLAPNVSSAKSEKINYRGLDKVNYALFAC